MPPSARIHTQGKPLKVKINIDVLHAINGILLNRIVNTMRNGKASVFFDDLCAISVSEGADNESVELEAGIVHPHFHSTAVTTKRSSIPLSKSGCGGGVRLALVRNSECELRNQENPAPLRPGRGRQLAN